MIKLIKGNFQGDEGDDSVDYLAALEPEQIERKR